MITLIAAISNNFGLGKNNQLLWHLPKDFKHFKSLTLNHPIIMGRKTYDSIGKPLPKRQNIVISRTEIEDNDIIWASSLPDALEKAKQLDNEIFIIGGGEIYKQSIDIADKLSLTFVDIETEADAFFPKINENIWKLAKEIFHPKDEKHKYDFWFKTFERKA